MKHFAPIVCAITLALFSCHSLQAQFATRQPIVTVPPMEEGTPTEARFTIRNLAMIPVYLDTNFADCGVVIKEFPRTLILPGHNVGIMATMRTKGRVGKFTKEIMLHGVGYKEVLKLTLQGSITPPKSPIVNYRDTTGTLVWDKVREAVGALTTADTFVFRCKNMGKEAVTLKALPTGSATPFTLIPADSLLQAGQATSVRIAYTPYKLTMLKQKRQEEFVQRLALRAGNLLVYLHLTGVMNLEYTDSLLKLAPIAMWPLQELNVGTLTAGESRLVVFEVRNNGKLPLALAAQSTPGDVLEVVGTTSEVPAGAIGKVTLRLKAGGQKGPVHRTVTVLQNDPNASSIVLHVRAWF